MFAFLAAPYWANPARPVPAANAASFNRPTMRGVDVAFSLAGGHKGSVTVIALSYTAALDHIADHFVDLDSIKGKSR